MSDVPASGAPEDDASPARGLRARWPQARIWLLISSILATGLTLLAGPVARMDAPGHGTVPVWALAVAFGATQVLVVHLHFRRSAHSFTLSELPLVVGLFYADPMHLVVASVLGM